MRARDRGEQIHLYAHHPGATVGIDKISAVLDDAGALGLPTVTYRDLATGAAPDGPAVVLSFDDQWIDSWYQSEPVFAAHGAHVTFFVARYFEFGDQGRAELHELAADGHDVEAHTMNHYRAPDYVADHGLNAWLANEALPSIDVLAQDGFAPPAAFAYPFGARTGETDHAMLDHVAVLRSVSFAFGAPVDDPCPY